MPVGGRGVDVDSDDEDIFTKKVAVSDKAAQESAPTYFLYGKLTITVDRAELQGDGKTKLNPFIQLKCGTQVFKTEVDTKGDKTPKWDNSYIIDMDGKREDNTLQLFVTDKGSLISSNIGRLEIAVDELFPQKDGKTAEATPFSLVHPKNKTKTTGKIWLKAQWDGRGMPWQNDLSVGAGGEKKAILMKGILHVTVHRAENLREVQLIGKQDPYVELRFGSYAYKTKVHEKAGASPIWNQDFVFNVEHKQSEQFSFLVYDKEPLVDNKIARIDLSIGELLKKKNKEQMLQLVFWENFKKIAGELFVTVRYEGEGAPITEEDLKKEELRKKKEQEELEAKMKREYEIAMVTKQDVESQAQKFINDMHEKHMKDMKEKEEQLAKEREEIKKALDEIAEHKRLAAEAKAETDKLAASKLEAEKFLAEAKAEALRVAAEAKLQADLVVEQIKRDAESKKNPPSEVREEGHPHPLKLIPSIYKGQYVCDRCQQRGSGQVYHCDICKFDMHPTCCVEYAQWQGTKPTALFPMVRDKRHNCPLFQIPSHSQGSYACAECGGKHQGEAFHCDPCKWNLCPRCIRPL